MASATAWAVTWVGATLLVVAGVAKFRRPAVTSESLAMAGMPDRPSLARALGVGEVLLAIVVLASGHRLAAGVLGLGYLGFAIVSGYLLTQDRASCGCFGEVEAPLSRVHVVTNGAIAAAAGLAAATGPAALPGSVGVFLLLALLASTGAGLVRALLVLLPALADGVRRLDTV